MASEAISSSIMIIGAVMGAAILMMAILPAIFSAGDTFGTVAHSAEQKLKTDFQIVNTYAKDGSPDVVKVWLKNVGANQISSYEIEKSDVFLGIGSSDYQRKTYDSGFTYSLDGDYWNIGETLEIRMVATEITISNSDVISFTFALPNSVRRSTTFSSNT